MTSFFEHPAHAHARGRRDRRDLARGRGHRHHERDARLGDASARPRSGCCARVGAERGQIARVVPGRGGCCSPLRVRSSDSPSALAGVALLVELYPAFPARPPLWAIASALGLALARGRGLRPRAGAARGAPRPGRRRWRRRWMGDLVRLAVGAIREPSACARCSRMLGIAIGIAAVILLTSIGEGTRRYILAQFSQFGTNLIAIHPGKAKTSGMPGVFGGTTHHLTIDDALGARAHPGRREGRADGRSARRASRAAGAAATSSSTASRPTSRTVGSSACGRAPSGPRAIRAAARR